MKLQGRLHTAATSARRRSRPARHGRTEWPCSPTAPNRVSSAVAKALTSSRRSRRVSSPMRVDDIPMPKRRSLVSRRIETQTVLPSTETAAVLFWALLTSGQITMRKVNKWQTLNEQLAAAVPVDLAA